MAHRERRRGRLDAGSPGTWEAEHRAIGVGSTTSAIEPGGPVDRAYGNCFALRFGADGRCWEFTEW